MVIVVKRTTFELEPGVSLEGIRVGDMLVRDRLHGAVDLVTEVSGDDINVLGRRIFCNDDCVMVTDELKLSEYNPDKGAFSTSSIPTIFYEDNSEFKRLNAQLGEYGMQW